MLNIYLNEQAIAIRANSSLHMLLTEQGYVNRPIAIARNQEMVPRSLWVSTILHPEDRIEVIIPMEGG